MSTVCIYLKGHSLILTTHLMIYISEDTMYTQENPISKISVHLNFALKNYGDPLIKNAMLQYNHFDNN